jgi:2-amino-4-hydroxy-6-hydroxymethyldihydropteridine diphosphokinase
LRCGRLFTGVPFSIDTRPGALYVPRRAPELRRDTHGAMSEIAYIALGSNLGDRDAYLALARDAIAAIPGCRVIGASRVEETAPLGGLAQPPYLNQMLAVETTLDPVALLAHLQRIEAAAGRSRAGHWSPRTLDLDIVLFDDRVVNRADLIVPHPGLADRPFWRRELAELRRTLDEDSE